MMMMMIMRHEENSLRFFLCSYVSYFNLINISVCIIVVFLLGENLRGDLKLNFLIGKLYSVSVSYSSSVVLGFFSRICCFTKKTHTLQIKKKSSSYHFFHKFFKYILRFFLNIYIQNLNTFPLKK